MFISTVPPCVDGTILFPFNRTNVLVEPKPLRSTVAIPDPGLFEVLSFPGMICGNWFRSDSALTVPVKVNSSAPKEATGEFNSKSWDWILVPVVTTSSTLSSDSSWATTSVLKNTNVSAKTEYK